MLTMMHYDSLHDPVAPLEAKKAGTQADQQAEHVEYLKGRPYNKYDPESLTKVTLLSQIYRNPVVTLQCISS